MTMTIAIATVTIALVACVTDIRSRRIPNILTLGGAVALGWVEAPEIVPRSWFEAEPYDIEVGGRRVPARASLSPMYDPKSERPKS